MMLCVGRDPELWFSGGRRQARAKKICGSCPIREECLEHALTNRIEFGVWGALTADERRKLRRKRSRNGS